MAFFDQIEQEVNTQLASQKEELVKQQALTALASEVSQITSLQEQLNVLQASHTENEAAFAARFPAPSADIPVEEMPQG